MRRIAGCMSWGTSKSLTMRARTRRNCLLCNLHNANECCIKLQTCVLKYFARPCPSHWPLSRRALEYVLGTLTLDCVTSCLESVCKGCIHSSYQITRQAWQNAYVLPQCVHCIAHSKKHAHACSYVWCILVQSNLAAAYMLYIVIMVWQKQWKGMPTWLQLSKQDVCAMLHLPGQHTHAPHCTRF